MAVANIDARAAQQQLQNNNFLVSLDRNNNLRRVILDPEELDYRRPSSRSMDIGISALPPVSTALAILQVQLMKFFGKSSSRIHCFFKNFDFSPR